MTKINYVFNDSDEIRKENKIKMKEEVNKLGKFKMFRAK